MRECENHEVIILGTFLVLAFSGLRFSDMQRTCTKSLHWSGSVLRGACWRTKTSGTGQLNMAQVHRIFSYPVVRDTASVSQFNQCRMLKHFSYSFLCQTLYEIALEDHHSIPWPATSDPTQCMGLSPLCSLGGASIDTSLCAIAGGSCCLDAEEELDVDESVSTEPDASMSSTRSVVSIGTAGFK